MFRRAPDRQRTQFYTAEERFEQLWRHNHPRRRQPTTPMTWEAIAACCAMLYDDAMARPYRHQLVLPRREGPLVVDRVHDPARGSWAWRREHRLEIHVAQRTFGTAVHEVAHLLTIGGHGWRFASVYRQMMGRHLHPDAERLLKTMYPWFGVRDRAHGMPNDGVPPYEAPLSARRRVAVAARAAACDAAANLSLAAGGTA
jgi:hypothetical protein